MSYFANIKNNIVQQVIIAEQEFVNNLPDAFAWVEVSLDEQSEAFAQIGYIYNENNKSFSPPVYEEKD